MISLSDKYCKVEKISRFTSSSILRNNFTAFRDISSCEILTRGQKKNVKKTKCDRNIENIPQNPKIVQF